jgi:UDP-N-acetylmuramyl pentapeptide phosphotransferase/UDP-N-acetylglucosamine-1-phosphate transferase
VSVAQFGFIFGCSLGVALLLVLTKRWHGRLTGDFENSGVQKHHRGSPPRIGALALLAGLAAGIALLAQADGPAAEAARMLQVLLLCAAPVVLFGLVEDVTKRVRARWRLLGALAGAVLAMALAGTIIPSVGFPLLDRAVTWLPAAVLLTLLMVTGFVNAMNIVDGLNGLAGGLALIMLAATGYAAYGAHDPLVLQLCLVLAAAVGGFMMINFPRGLIFLGDGGAYLLGFLLGQLWILLLVRNPGEVSPWFVIAVAFHPTMETIYSIVRRKLRPRKRKAATAPDCLHLHSLVYHRKTKGLRVRHPWLPQWVPNSMAAVAVLAMALVPPLAAMLMPESTAWNLIVVAISIWMYLWFFRRLVHFGVARRFQSSPTRERAVAGAAERM